jgi:hypothetical protein
MTGKYEIREDGTGRFLVLCHRLKFDVVRQDWYWRVPKKTSRFFNTREAAKRYGDKFVERCANENESSNTPAA